MSGAPAARPAPVVTLVHGTFGRLPGADAAWTPTGAPLQRMLRSRLGDDTIGLARHRHAKIAGRAPRTPIHIVRGVGDEASALLATSSFFSWLVTLVWNLASALTTGVAIAFAAILFAPLLLPAALALLVESRLGKTRLRHALGRALRSRTVGATVIAFGAFGAFASWGFFLAGTAYGTAEQWYGAAVATLVFAIVSFSALSGLAYGLTAPFLEVTAEATPPGSWETHLFEAGAWTSADGTHASRPAFLSHSAAYADETVLDSIACWMAAQGGGRAATPAKGESASTQLAAGRGGR